MAAEPSLNIPFWKMHGAGNDFILVDDRSASFPPHDAGWIEALCRRRTGVGSDGLILLQPADSADFRMRFFNPDGLEAGMCGNGARCAARLAFELGLARADMTIETGAGRLGAGMEGAQVRLHMTEPHDWALRQSLRVGDRTLEYSFVNTGVPHAVLQVEDLATCDVANLGRAIRRHAAFAPAGANANFLAVTGGHDLTVRTYERGVEAETLACGTGVTAAALVAVRLGLVRTPVRVTVRSGSVLVVDCRQTGDRVSDVTLLGPAEHVFTGVLVYHPDAGVRTEN